AASTAAFTQSYGAFQQAALQQEPSYRVRGILTDGFDSTTNSMRTLFPEARLGNCLRHAINKLPAKLTSIASPVRKALRSQFHTLLYRARQRKGLRVFALGQRLRHFADRVAQSAGEANGARVRRWFHEKKAGWYAVLADPQMPVTSTLLDQAHNAIERKLFTMKGFHHPSGSQQAFVTGLAHLYNLIPYQHRAKHAGQCGVEVEGGRVPTADWMLSLQILTSGGFRSLRPHSTTKLGGMWIVRDDDLRHPTQGGQGPHMGANPVRQTLCPRRFDIGIVGGPQHGNEQRRLMDFAGLGVDDWDALARIIDKELLSR